MEGINEMENLFWKVFRNNGLREFIFSKIKSKLYIKDDGKITGNSGGTLINGNSIPYDEIRNFDWMIKNKLFGILKDKIINNGNIDIVVGSDENESNNNINEYNKINFIGSDLIERFHIGNNGKFKLSIYSIFKYFGDSVEFYNCLFQILSNEEKTKHLKDMIVHYDNSAAFESYIGKFGIQENELVESFKKSIEIGSLKIARFIYPLVKHLTFETTTIWNNVLRVPKFMTKPMEHIERIEMVIKEFDLPFNSNDPEIDLNIQLIKQVDGKGLFKFQIYDKPLSFILKSVEIIYLVKRKLNCSLESSTNDGAEFNDLNWVVDKKKFISKIAQNCEFPTIKEFISNIRFDGCFDKHNSTIPHHHFTANQLSTTLQNFHKNDLIVKNLYEIMLLHTKKLNFGGVGNLKRYNNFRFYSIKYGCQFLEEYSNILHGNLFTLPTYSNVPEHQIVYQCRFIIFRKLNKYNAISKNVKLDNFFIMKKYLSKVVLSNEVSSFDCYFNSLLYHLKALSSSNQNNTTSSISTTSTHPTSPPFSTNENTLKINVIRKLFKYINSKEMLDKLLNKLIELGDGCLNNKTNLFSISQESIIELVKKIFTKYELIYHFEKSYKSYNQSIIYYLKHTSLSNWYKNLDECKYLLEMLSRYDLYQNKEIGNLFKCLINLNYPLHELSLFALRSITNLFKSNLNCPRLNQSESFSKKYYKQIKSIYNYLVQLNNSGSNSITNLMFAGNTTTHINSKVINYKIELLNIDKQKTNDQIQESSNNKEWC